MFRIPPINSTLIPAPFETTNDLFPIGEPLSRFEIKLPTPGLCFASQPMGLAGGSKAPATPPTIPSQWRHWTQILSDRQYTPQNIAEISEEPVFIELEDGEQGEFEVSFDEGEHVSNARYFGDMVVAIKNSQGQFEIVENPVADVEHMNDLKFEQKTYANGLVGLTGGVYLAAVVENRHLKVKRFTLPVTVEFECHDKTKVAGDTIKKADRSFNIQHPLDGTNATLNGKPVRLVNWIKKESPDSPAQFLGEAIVTIKHKGQTQRLGLRLNFRLNGNDIIPSAWDNDSQVGLSRNGKTNGKSNPQVTLYQPTSPRQTLWLQFGQKWIGLRPSPMSYDPETGEPDPKLHIVYLDNPRESDLPQNILDRDQALSPPILDLFDVTHPADHVFLDPEEKELRRVLKVRDLILDIEKFPYEIKARISWKKGHLDSIVRKGDSLKKAEGLIDFLRVEIEIARLISISPPDTWSSLAQQVNRSRYYLEEYYRKNRKDRKMARGDLILILKSLPPISYERFGLQNGIELFAAFITHLNLKLTPELLQIGRDFLEAHPRFDPMAMPILLAELSEYYGNANRSIGFTVNDMIEIYEIAARQEDGRNDWKPYFGGKRAFSTPPLPPDLVIRSDAIPLISQDDIPY